jgi:hypothetical protein
MHRTPALFLLATMACACVPNGPSRASDGGTGASPEPPKKPPKPAPTQRTATSATASPPLTAPFEDKFERSSIGSDWFAVASGVWEIKDGKLCGRNARNRGIWLLRTLPTNARIEFDAVSSSSEGDLKAEYWGDGRSGATAASYNNATSYLTIFGGWKNTFHVLARINEHAADRLQVALSNDAIEERERPVVAGRTYGFKIERADGKTVSWWVDGVLIHRLEDKQPLLGEGHDHFGFNNWEVGVCFDNVKLTPL